MRRSKLKNLTIALALLAGMPNAYALTPWKDGAPPAANTFYLPGGSAQDAAVGRVILDLLAAPGTLDVFGDSTTATSNNFGGRWTVYYFRGSSALGTLAGQPVAIVKRALGAVGYGIIPVLANPPLAIEQLDISTLSAPGAGNTTVFADTGSNTVAGAAGNYRVVVTAANAPTLLPLKLPSGGLLTIDARVMLKPGSKNYPVTVPRVGAGADKFPSNVTAFPAKFSQLSTGGLVYGVGVNTDFYKILQAAQKRAGQLPADTVIGDYEHEANIPSLPGNFIGSLIAGKVKLWDDVKIVDKKAGSPTFGEGLPLTHPSILADAGVALPKTNAAGKVPVAVSNRPAGTALTTLAYAKFLGYPWVAGSFAPPTVPTNNLLDNTSAPIIKEPGSINNTGLLLDDWNQGTNTSALNLPSAKRWGVGFMDGTRNTSGAVGVNPEDVGKLHWRFVRIDGYLPKIANVASGGYRYWCEGAMIFDKSTLSAGGQKVLTVLANGLASPSVAAFANAGIVHTWGQTGIFALTQNNTNYKTDIPYKDSNPVIPYTSNSGAVHAEIAPVVYDSARANGLLLQGLPQ